MCRMRQIYRWRGLHGVIVHRIGSYVVQVSRLEVLLVPLDSKKILDKFFLV
jgi:hypothetical protein